MNYASVVTPIEDSGALIEAPIRRGTRPDHTPVLLEYWTLVQRWRWVILGIVSLCLLAGIVITFLMTPQYTTKARLEISREEQRVTNVEGLQARDANRELEFYETQYALLKARSVAERVARDLRLASSAEFFMAHGATSADAEIGSNKPPTPAVLQAREAQAVKLLLANVNVSPLPRSALVDVAYTSASPTLSAAIANSWAEQFLADGIDRRFASTADARKFLEQRLGDLRARMQQSERELVNYANEKGIIVFNHRTEDGRTEASQTLASTNLESLNQALLEATSRRMELEARARVRGSASTALLSNQAITALRQRRAEASAEYSQLMVQFEPGYPAASAAHRNIEALDVAIGREEARVRFSLDADYRSALEREKTLKAKVAALTGTLIQQERDKIQYNIYQREVDTNRQLYEGLLQRYKEIGVASISASNIAIVDRAQVPETPSSPNLPLNLAIALLAGFGLAGAAVFALDQIDEGLRQPGEVQRALGIPLLGSVPIEEEGTSTELVDDPKSRISEAYHTVRSNLAFSTDHGVPRSFTVTSTRPREGKSTSSFALAMVIARTGKRVLLIDADLRSPSVHRFTEIENTKGLSNYLAGEDAWESLVRSTRWPSLSVMTTGPIPPSAAELLSSDRAHLLVQQLLLHFDHIILDAPPLLGLADAPLLSRVTEGVVYIVEAQGPPLRGINMSLSRLQASHAHVFGAVLTKLKSRDSSYGYGYGYGYGLNYGESTDKR